MNPQQLDKARRVHASLTVVRITFIARDGTEFDVEYSPAGADKITDILAGLVAPKPAAMHELRSPHV